MRLPRNVVRFGHRLLKRKVTDTAPSWTMIQARPFKRSGTLLGFGIYANKPGRPVIFWLFQRAGRKGHLMPVFRLAIPARNIKYGVNMVRFLCRQMQVFKMNKSLT